MSETKTFETVVLCRYWEKYYAKGKFGICTLCGNTGWVDTTLTAISPNGIKTGLRQPCFCPNGQAQRKDQKEQIEK